jgi:hypothetical protein
MAGSTPKHAQITNWRPLKLGTHRSASDLRREIESAHFKISYGAADILDKVTVAPAETTIELVNVSVFELGFYQSTTYSDLCARANLIGLSLVPAEAGPQLRLQYTELSEEWLVIAMDPIAGSGGCLRLFSVAYNQNAYWLRTYYGYPYLIWHPENRLVFTPDQ